MGASGSKGSKGDKGDTGATGAKGEKGDKGDKGEDGVVTISNDNIDILKDNIPFMNALKTSLHDDVSISVAELIDLNELAQTLNTDIFQTTIANKMKDDTSFVNDLKGKDGAQGPQGPAGTIAGLSGGWSLESDDNTFKIKKGDDMFIITKDANYHLGKGNNKWFIQTNASDQFKIRKDNNGTYDSRIWLGKDNNVESGIRANTIELNNDWKLNSESSNHFIVKKGSSNRFAVGKDQETKTVVYSDELNFPRGWSYIVNDNHLQTKHSSNASNRMVVGKHGTYSYVRGSYIDQRADNGRSARYDGDSNIDWK